MSIPVFFTPRMVADSGSYSPSAGKPAAVVQSWRQSGFDIEVVEPQPLTAAERGLAHDRGMVEEILAGRRDNGFGNRSAAVAAALPYTSGAMYSAAVRALTDRAVAAATCSGFHHAGWDEAALYCTFNGLVVAARMLRMKHKVSRVGILDFDQHCGNGTDDIIDRLGLDWITHHTAGAHPRSPDDAEGFLCGVPEIVAQMRRAGCEVILYQAGADMHVKDPLGGFLTTPQLLRRDFAVFEACLREGLPVAWNLAGGYQRDGNGIRPVLDIHDNTMRACLQIFGRRFGMPVRGSDQRRAQAEGLDADPVHEGLWQGAHPPEGALLAGMGFTLAIFCAEEIRPRAGAWPGVRTLWAPNVDDDTLDRARLRRAIAASRAAADEIRRGGKVLAACAAGLNRSGLVSALTLARLSRFRTPMSEIVKLLQQRRAWALSNEHFVGTLHRLEDRVHARRAGRARARR